MDDQRSNGSAISDALRRLLDGRGEQRQPAGSRTVLLNHRGHRHVVQLSDISESGVMILAEGDFVEGDEVVLHLLDQGSVTGQVRWVRDGRVGVNFADSGGQADDE